MKVLQCFAAENFAYGGQEEFLMNMFTNFKNENISYVFYTPFIVNNKKFKKISEDKNIEIYSDNKCTKHKIRGKIAIKKGFKNFLKNNKFDVIHIHSGWMLGLYWVAKLARKEGIKKVIVHSHNTGIASLKSKIYKVIIERNLAKYSDDFLACSVSAGKWMFPQSIINNGQLLIIKNGIDVNKFKFNQISREKYRKEFGLSDNELVLLNVGRFSEQKNHKFIVQIAKRLKEENVKFKFILVGEGELKAQIQSEIIGYDLMDNFIFLEKRVDVAEIMSASDIFVLPSIFEGLGIVAIEAQASGLQTIVSTEVPNEANLTDLFIKLDFDVDKWINVILDNSKNKRIRESYAMQIEDAGYSAKKSAKVLEEIYLGESTNGKDIKC